MKKFLTLLTIGFFTVITGCEGNSTIGGNPNDNPNNPSDNPGEVTPPVKTEYELYIESLLEIVNVEKNKVFERYGDFTDVLEEYIYLGDYPGREVTNEELVAKLDGITTTNEYGYIELEGLNFVKVTIQNTYTSLEIGEEEYENSTRYKIGTTHYFLVEPILWRVLSTNMFTNELFLISNNILDAQIYVTETGTRLIDGRIIYPSNYEHSDIRKWCNNVFYNQAFSTEEQAVIRLKTINNQYPVNLGVECNDRDTEDYVYIPSFQEMTEELYGYEELGIFSYSRFSTPSDFASAKGVYTSDLEETGQYSGLYLLRTGPEYVKSFTFFVKFDGYALNPYYVNSPSTGVRVCMKITNPTQSE